MVNHSGCSKISIAVIPFISGCFLIVPGVNHQPSPRPVIGALLAITKRPSSTALIKAYKQH